MTFQVNAKRLLMVLVCSVFFTSENCAQNFFWSTLPFEAGAVSPQAVVNPLLDGPTGTVFLYYEAGGSNITEGLDLSFSWTVNGVVGFTAAETFDADITFGTNGPVLFDRWGDFSGPANVVNFNEVTGFLTINLTSGTGIQQANIPGNLDQNGIDFVDTLYDTTANAFLIGSIDYEFLGPGIALLQADGLVLDGVDIGASFASIQFGNLPEPSTAGMLVLGLFGFAAQRRRGDFPSSSSMLESTTI